MFELFLLEFSSNNNGDKLFISFILLLSFSFDIDESFIFELSSICFLIDSFGYDNIFSINL